MFDTKFWALAFFGLSSAGLMTSIHLAIRSGKIEIPAPPYGTARSMMVFRDKQPRLFQSIVVFQCMLATGAVGLLLFVVFYW